MLICLHAEKNGYWPFSIKKRMPETEFKALLETDSVVEKSIS